MKNIRLRIWLPALLAGILLSMGSVLFFTAPRDTSTDYKFLSLLAETTSLIDSNYVDAVSPGEKMPGAFDAMLKSLDKLSSYLDAEKTKVYSLFLQGKAAGIGVCGLKLFNFFTLTAVEPGSTADRAGLKKGDIIKAVNGQSLYSLSYWSMAMSLFSVFPQEIELIVLKKNENKPARVNLITEILPPGKLWQEKEIVVVSLTKVDAVSVSTLQRNFAAKKPSPIIFDLRKYVGGDFNSFKAVCRLLFKENTLRLKTRKGIEDHRLGSADHALYRAAVIIDESTILYNELLAALFKKDGHALLGIRTSGCASFLQSFPFSDGSSLVLTTGTFAIGSDSVGRIGIEPTIAIKEENMGRVYDIAGDALKKVNDKKEKV